MAEQVDAGVGAAADAREGEAQPAQGGLHCVFVVRADVDGAGGVEADAGGVGEEAGEVVVVWGVGDGLGERVGGFRLGCGGGGGLPSW